MVGGMTESAEEGRRQSMKVGWRITECITEYVSDF